MQSGVPRTRTCRPERVFLLPLGYTLSFTCWSEHETEVPAAGEDRVNGLPFCGLRPRCFSRRSECKLRRARREYRAEEKRKSNNRREKWARFESGLNLRNRTPADNSRRNLICRSVNHRDEIGREMRSSETDPVLDNSPYGKSVTANAPTDRIVRIRERKR